MDDPYLFLKCKLNWFAANSTAFFATQLEVSIHFERIIQCVLDGFRIIYIPDI